MTNAEQIQQFGKEQFETAVGSASNFQQGLQAIATAYGDYAKKSLEDGNAYLEKLSGVRSLDKAVEVQTEYAKVAYENFVAQAQKVAGLYADLVKIGTKPFEGFVAKVNSASH